MFERTILKELEKWETKQPRKPLVLRGARQVGKTTLVDQYARKFDNYLYLNLELPENKQPFEQFTNIETLVQTIFFLKNTVYSKDQRTLIFIDEIQESPEALNVLRYFYESYPELHVIAAGSLLESLFRTDVSFPVGRVEYLVVRPASFPEFLNATGETAALTQLQKVPVPAFSHQKLLSLFHTYALIGGMPEVVNHYAQDNDLTGLQSIYESLIVSYLDDVEKYASSQAQVQTIRHAIRSSYTEAGKRIKFEGFGKSNYRSREMGEALRTLEKALLIYLLYPNTGVTLPLTPDLRKSPRLHVLDTGMMNYFVGVQKDILGTIDLNDVYQGTIIEHLVGQELLASQFNALSNLHFWVREKKTSTAEVDYIVQFDGKIIPVEVKSGTEGKLRSLHLYMDIAPHSLAVRFYAGEWSVTESVTSSGKKYHLLNLPYYLASQLSQCLEWFSREYGE